MFIKDVEKELREAPQGRKKEVKEVAVLVLEVSSPSPQSREIASDSVFLSGEPPESLRKGGD